MNLFHRHTWKILEQHTEQSPVEAARALGMNITTKGAWPDELQEIHRRPVVVKARCETCGSETVYRA